ncbi:MAG TPA: adenylyl-sulfate kinase, partial [Bacteroidia bacterium]|nr:adenylyl-sulfate kinase [Bacteroidia bacterium]
MSHSENIHPVFDRLLQRADREKLLGQKAKVIWLTGLSGSGKSTLAIGLERELHRTGKLVYVLDGDNVRTGINSNIGFSEEDRKENIRRIAEVAKLFLEAGVITICSFVSPTEELRAMAKQIIGADNFLEMYVNASLENCEKRDVKGLYAKARKGEIKDFTGIHQAFEAPQHPWLEIKTDTQSPAESLAL